MHTTGRNKVDHGRMVEHGRALPSSGRAWSGNGRPAQEIHEYQQKSMEIHRMQWNQWKSMKSMESNQNQWRSTEIHGHQIENQ